MSGAGLRFGARFEKRQATAKNTPSESRMLDATASVAAFALSASVYLRPAFFTLTPKASDHTASATPTTMKAHSQAPTSWRSDSNVGVL